MELAFKLTEYADRPRMKNSPGKQSFPGRKQIYRRLDPNGRLALDVVAGRDEVFDGEPLLKPVMRRGQIIEGAIPTLDSQVESAKRAMDSLPSQFRSLQPAHQNPVVISDFLRALQRDTIARVCGG